VAHELYFLPARRTKIFGFSGAKPRAATAATRRIKPVE
jgi:hypothetical protein